MYKKPIIILFLIVSAAVPIFASSEEGGEKAPEASEGEGGAAAKGPGKLPEWAELINKVGQSKAKIVAKEQLIQKLIQDKNALPPGSPQAKTIVDQLIQEHKTLREYVKEYDQQRSRLKYRFPEKGIKEERRYQRIEVRSLEEMETQHGVDGNLEKSLSKMRSQYGIDEETKKKIDKKKNKKQPAVEEKPLELEGPPIITK